MIAGAKTALFSDVYVMEDDFPPYIENLILHSRGFKRVDILGRVVSEIIFK